MLDSLFIRKSSRLSRPGFTLIEVLVVMSIILILAGIVVGVQRGVYHKQSQAKARGEVQTIATALESYRLKYGDYPWLGADVDGKELFSHLTGQKVMRPGPDSNPNDTLGGGVQMDSIDDSVDERPLLEASKFKLNSSNDAFVDPWGNPYRYYYIADNATPDSAKDRLGDSGWASWYQPGFILISAGPDGDIGSLTGLSTGEIEEGYHEDTSDTAKLDNIVYGIEF